MSLRNLSRFRNYLVSSISDLKRKVICILDQVFPEYQSIFSDVFGTTSKERTQCDSPTYSPTTERGGIIALNTRVRTKLTMLSSARLIFAVFPPMLTRTNPKACTTTRSKPSRSARSRNCVTAPQKKDKWSRTLPPWVTRVNNNFPQIQDVVCYKDLYPDRSCVHTYCRFVHQLPPF